MDRTKKRELLTILSRIKQTSNLATQSSASQSGFTLIEILLVLAIAVMLISFGMPVVSRITGQNITTTARKLTSVLRGVRTDAILLNTIYRLSLDLDKNTYLVEVQNSPGLLSEEALLSKQDDPKKKGEPASPSPFSTADKYFKEPKELPGGVVFNGVLKEKEGLVKTGTAYIYFFPNGFNEKAIIIFNSQTAKEGGYSLVLQPTAGKVEFFKKRVDQF